MKVQINVFLWETERTWSVAVATVMPTTETNELLQFFHDHKDSQYVDLEKIEKNIFSCKKASLLTM